MKRNLGKPLRLDSSLGVSLVRSFHISLWNSLYGSLGVSFRDNLYDSLRSRYET